MFLSYSLIWWTICNIFIFCNHLSSEHRMGVDWPICCVLGTWSICSISDDSWRVNENFLSDLVDYEVTRGHFVNMTDSVTMTHFVTMTHSVTYYFDTIDCFTTILINACCNKQPLIQLQGWYSGCSTTDTGPGSGQIHREWKRDIASLVMSTRGRNLKHCRNSALESKVNFRIYGFGRTKSKNYQWILVAT